MPESILVVEDESVMRDVLVEYLEQQGYLCRWAIDGKMGLARLQEQEYDLILTDLKLPGADGFTIIERANELQPLTPKIIMTGHSEIEDTLRAIQLGAFDFIRKPLPRLEEFHVVIRRGLAHGRLLKGERKHKAEIERMNERLEDEVNQRTKELSHANQELRTLDEMKNNLLANVSHELRTPLVSVRGYTELFHSGQLCHIPEEHRKHLATCLRNIDKLLRLIESLVRYAELARHKVSAQIHSIDACSAASKAIEKSRTFAKGKDIDFIISLPDTPMMVLADPVLLIEIFRHLLENAIKFSPAKSEVTLKILNSSPKLLEISVEDKGPGIPEEEQQRIFERFYQIDSSATRKHGGTGIGLAIVRDNLRLMGAEIQLRSEEEHGSVFFFTMPLTDEQ